VKIREGKVNWGYIGHSDIHFSLHVDDNHLKVVKLKEDGGEANLKIP
jgi:hypothetical protein